MLRDAGAFSGTDRQSRGLPPFLDEVAEGWGGAPQVGGGSMVGHPPRKIRRIDAVMLAIRAQIVCDTGKFTGSRFLSEPKRRLSQENPWAPESSLAAQPAIAVHAE